MTEYKIHDIPDYPYLFIRDGGFVYLTNKHTGEIERTLTLYEYVNIWTNEYKTNQCFLKHYQSDLFLPKNNPDTATTLKELRSLCSDNTRTGRGDTGYLVDFLTSDKCNVTETKLLTLLSKHVDVWNYSVCTWNDIKDGMSVGEKQLKRVYTSLIDKGLMIELNNKFEAGGKHWCLLIKIHPRLFWKGRYSAFINAVSDHYEYSENISLGN